MAILMETVEALRAKMEAMPVADTGKQELSKQQAVSELREAIALLQERGYSLEAIAKTLSEGGVELKTTTLKSYLQRSKGTKSPAKRKPKADAPKAAEKATSAPTKAGGGEAVEKAKKVIETTKPTQAGGASFQVKDDTQDI
jgi:hypothetical protein